jgi:hypothetical protein
MTFCDILLTRCLLVQLTGGVLQHSTRESTHAVKKGWAGYVTLIVHMFLPWCHRCTNECCGSQAKYTHAEYTYIRMHTDRGCTTRAVFTHAWTTLCAQTALIIPRTREHVHIITSWRNLYALHHCLHTYRNTCYMYTKVSIVLHTIPATSYTWALFYGSLCTTKHWHMNIVMHAGTLRSCCKAASSYT